MKSVCQVLKGKPAKNIGGGGRREGRGTAWQQEILSVTEKEKIYVGSVRRKCMTVENEKH